MLMNKHMLSGLVIAAGALMASPAFAGAAKPATVSKAQAAKSCRYYHGQAHDTSGYRKAIQWCSLAANKGDFSVVPTIVALYEKLPRNAANLKRLAGWTWTEARYYYQLGKDAKSTARRHHYRTLANKKLAQAKRLEAKASELAQHANGGGS